MTTKPYVSALHAADLLGCTRAAVVADVKAGMRGALGSLCGAVTGDICVVSSWDLEGDRLAMHRARLADTSDACIADEAAVTTDREKPAHE